MSRNWNQQATILKPSNIISGSMGYGLPGEAFAGDGIIDKATNKKIE